MLVSYLLIQDIFHIFFYIPIVDFEELYICWAIFETEPEPL